MDPPAGGRKLIGSAGGEWGDGVRWALTVGSRRISWEMYGTFRGSERGDVSAAGSLLPFQPVDGWLMASVRLELIQDQFHSSGRSEEAEISLATMPPDNLIKPVKENLGAEGTDGLLMSRVPECTSVFLRLTRLRQAEQSRVSGDV